jgi:hypothetical protein
MLRYKYSVLLLALAAGCLFSCKKKANDNPTGTIKLATVDIANSGNRYHYHVVYDASNNVDSITMVGGGLDTGHYGFEKFSYFGTSYSITDQTGFSYTVYANSNGMIIKVLLHDTLNMFYKGVELTQLDIVTATTTYPYTTKSSTVYSWANGDVSSISSPAGAFTFDYNQGKTGQVGDPFRIDDFLTYGRPYLKTSHLPTDKIQNGTWTEKYYYEFDGAKRISKLMKVKNLTSGNDTVSYYYSYY